MKYCIFLWLLLLLFINGSAQQQSTGGFCKVKGKIIDSATETAIGYAAVTIYADGNTNIAGGIITDEQGTFIIDNLTPGKYRLKIECLGYSVKSSPNIMLTGKPSVFDLGTIKVASNSKNMKEVTVTGSKNFMENHLDKFVYNVEKDITSQGGVATDILQKIPQVSVDVDGNIELLGNANIRVFINGRPSTMFDNNLSEALQAIPASQIKSIEVITTPGAQYDAQGTGGIINIILKDNNSRGINGSVTMSGGTRLENGSANVHAKTGAFDISASLSGNAQLKSTTTNNVRNSHSDSTLLLENGQGVLQRNGYKGQLGAGWAISKKDNITASVSYNNFGNTNNGITYQQQINYLPFYTDTSTIRNSNNTFHYSTLDWNISYVKKFEKDGQELDLSYQSSNGSGHTFYDQAEEYGQVNSLFAGTQGNNRLKDNETYVVADYAQPVGKNIMLNFGLKGSFSNINSYSDLSILNTLSDVYVADPSQTNNFDYKREVYAAYASATFPLSDVYSMKLGLRNEYTKINIPGDTTDPSYNSFIPSIVISRKIGDNQTIKISYTHRIQRAGYKELNPFIDATDPNNLLQGNPYLKPERSNVGELTYTRSFEKGTALLVTLFYRNTEDDEQSYVKFQDTLSIGNTIYKNVTITSNENAGHQQLTGLNISGNLAISQKLEIRCNAMLFDKYIQSNFIPGNTINSFNYRINANATYQFSKKLVAELFGNFNSARTEIQGKFPSFSSYSIAIRYLINKKASIGFTATDPFTKYVDQATNINGEGFAVYNDRKIPYRSFGLSFTYKFGKMEFKDKKQDHIDPNGENDN